MPHFSDVAKEGLCQYTDVNFYASEENGPVRAHKQGILAKCCPDREVFRQILTSRIKGLRIPMAFLIHIG